MKLADYLRLTGTTEWDFARRIGVSQSAVNRYAHGKHTPRQETLRAIKEATGGQVTADDFLDGAPDPTPADNGAVA